MAGSEAGHPPSASVFASSYAGQDDVTSRTGVPAVILQLPQVSNLADY